MADFRSTLLVCFAALGLTGCYEELVDLVDDGAPGGMVVEGVTTTITGVPVKGFAYCDVVVREPVGTVLSEFSYRPAGVVVGQPVDGGPAVPQPTEADVRFTLTVRDYVGAAVIEATNCSYEDETTALRFDLAIMRAPIVIPEEGGTLSVAITPLTEIAYAVAVERGGGLPQGISVSGIEASYRLVRNGLAAGNLFDPLTTIPAVATFDSSADASDAAVQYGLILAAFSGAIANWETLISTFSDDFSTGGLRDFYAILEEGAAAFDQSGRNRTGRPAAAVVATVTEAAINTE